MSKNQKLLTSFVIGAAAGAAAVIFFKTEKGKQLLTDLKDAADEIFNNLFMVVKLIDDDSKSLIYLYFDVLIPSIIKNN